MTDFFIFKVLNKLFSNPLIIDQVKTKKITTVKEVWIPDHNKHRFDDFTSAFTPQGLRRYIKHLRQCFIGYPSAIPRISSNRLRCASHFQLSSRCLDISMKHCLSCFLYYLKNAMDPPCVCRAPWLVKKNRATHFIQSARGFQLSLLLYNIHAIPHKARLRCRCWWEK